ncbi:MAG: inorganic phosphate transporter, partial [Amylibacter sp.]|nr:inorganic phosphate transporter [Amylibacter sp.]
MSDKDYEQRHLETLDRDLGRLSGLNHPTTYLAHPLMSIGISFVFIVLAGSIAMFFFENTANVLIVGVAAGLGAYMALNIGANDVANNMGPAVGANALTMGGAIAIAAIFESAG